MSQDFYDYYKFFEIEPTATPEQIKQAYHRLAKILHPDYYPDRKFTESELEEMRVCFTRANEVYQILRTPELRKEYDKEYYARKQKKQEELKREEERRREEERQREQERQREEERQKEQEKKKTQYQEEYKTHFEDTRRNPYGEEEKERARYYREHPEDDETILGDLKKSYKEIRKEEQKHPFRKRHRRINRIFERNYESEIETPKDVVVFYLKNGVVHVVGETLFQLEKLSYIGKDTVPKFIIRNRKLILAATLTGMIISFGGKDNPDPVNPIIQTENQNDVTLIQTVEEENSNITLIRNYRIKNGDTLSNLAEDSYNTVRELKWINELSSDMIYMGDIIKMPYKIKKEDLQYYSQVIQTNEKSLYDLAKEYETDIDTLYELNKESIQEVKGVYIILSDTIIVPKFPSRSEVDTIKTKNTKSY